MKLKYIVVVSLVLASLAWHSHADDIFASSNSPVEIESDEVRFLTQENRAIFSGNVVAQQDETVIKSQSMIVQFSEKEGGKSSESEERNVEKITFEHHVQITTAKDKADGDKGEYNATDGIFKLIGNVKLEQEGNVLTGDELIYAKDSGRSVLKSNSNGRVKAKIIPKDQGQK